MKTYITIDIETIPQDINDFSEKQLKYLLKDCKTDEEQNAKQTEFGLSALTGKICCIGVNITKNEHNSQSIAFLLGQDENNTSSNVYSYAENEKTLLNNFWSYISEEISKSKNILFITFNGRSFDFPFIMMRSAINEITPLYNLMGGSRWNYSDNHIDLVDEFTFMGTTKRYNLDYYTSIFGITSPKQKGIDGSSVNSMFKEGLITEIGDYCIRDIEATRDLFFKWKKIMNK